MKLKNISIFFILAFTFSTFCFLLATSMINGKSLYNKKYNQENNKLIDFTTTTDINVDEILDLLNERDLTISLGKFILAAYDKENSGYEVTTILKSNKYNTYEDLINGRYITDEEFLSNKKIGVTTVGKDNIMLKKDGSDFNIEKIGEISSGIKVIILPQKTFFEYVGSTILKPDNITMALSGERDEIAKSLVDIEKYIKNLDKNNEILVTAPILSDDSLESNFLFLATVLIIFITVLNSICISSLWVKERKREFILRKTCGAKNRDIFKIFFKELLSSLVIAFIFALILYFITITITKNMLFGIKISMSLVTLITTILVSILTAFMVALPSMKYISKLQLIEILREE